MNQYPTTIQEIRKFNRFYTVNMGFLDLEYYDTNYSIAEIRILFEMLTYRKCFQSELVKNLHIDKSYVSRIIKRFHKEGLLEKEQADKDKRAAYIYLTEKGQRETEQLIALTNSQIEKKIKTLSSAECIKLCEAMDTIISILGKKQTEKMP